MCSIGYHICPDCQDEYKCDQPNSECPVLNNYNGPCARCEHWIDEHEREILKDERRRWEQDQWIRDHGFDGD